MNGIIYEDEVIDYTNYLKRKKAEFLETELGNALVSCVIAWASLRRRTSNESVLKYTQTKWEVFQLVLKDRFRKEYHMVLDADNIHCGVLADDGSEWLFKADLNTFNVL